MAQTPVIDKTLIDFLSRMYPDVSPELSMTEREIFFRRGAVDVVRTLKRIYSEQNEDILNVER
mgnify:CR=1 FL=1|jgi:hypothetical protein